MPKKSKEKPKNKNQKKIEIPKLRNKPEVATHRIDASGKILGRLATEMAVLIRGKHKPSFRPNLLMGDKVIVINASKIRVTGTKMRDKLYYRHTGYLGHLKSQSLEDLFKRNPAEVLYRAVRGMLPKNKLQDKCLKNLIIFNGEENG